MSSIQNQRASRIQELVPILDVLYEYGYRIDPGNLNPQQFSCDLHGSGMDRKPSGRVYPESNNWYCWGCGKSRDAIETVREKEHISFSEACRNLEKRFNLPEVDWGASEGTIENDEDAFALYTNPKFSEFQERCRRILDLETEDKDLPMQKILALWETFDQINFLVGKNVLTEERGVEAFDKIKEKVISLRKTHVGA